MREKSEVVIVIYTDLSKCWQECRWKINENGPEYEKSAVSGQNSLLPLGQMYVLYIMIIFYHLEWLKSWSTTILYTKYAKQFQWMNCSSERVKKFWEYCSSG